MFAIHFKLLLVHIYLDKIGKPYLNVIYKKTTKFTKQKEIPSTVQSLEINYKTRMCQPNHLFV